MSSQQRPDQDRLVTLIGQVLRGLRPQVSEESPLIELTLPQLRTLFLLHAQGPMRMSEISSHLGVGMPTVTSLVSKLEDKGLVAREHDTKDRRVVFCSTTQWGRDEAEQFWRIRREQISQLTDSLREEEAELVAQAMEIILQVLERGQKALETKEQEPSFGENCQASENRLF